MAGLAGRLASRQHRVDLITLDDGRRSRHSISDEVRWLPLDVMSTADKRTGWQVRIMTLRAAIDRGEYDVVLSFCDTTNLLVLLATRGLRGCPRIVVSERSDPAHQTMGRVREWLRGHLYPRADAVICLSDDVAATFNHRMKLNTIVIPSAVDRPPPGYSQLRALHQETSTIRLIAIGRLEVEKGFHRLLNSLRDLLQDEEVPAWRLKILGSGSELGMLETLARAQGIADRVEFCGWVDNVWSHLADADVFVLPSIYEGFPSAMLEAMAGGLAVVAVDAGGGVLAAIEHDHTGWLVENSDSALKTGLRILLTDPDLRTRISAAAPEVIDRFGWETMVDAYERVLRE